MESTRKKHDSVFNIFNFDITFKLNIQTNEVIFKFKNCSFLIYFSRIQKNKIISNSVFNILYIDIII